MSNFKNIFNLTFKHVCCGQGLQCQPRSGEEQKSRTNGIPTESLIKYCDILFFQKVTFKSLQNSKSPLKQQRERILKKYSKTGTASAAAAAASAKKGGKRKTRKQLQLEKKQRQKEEDEELEKIRLERLLEENQPTQGEKLRNKDRDAL